MKRTILLTAASFAAALLLAEVILYVANISYPVYTQPDEYRGTALKPNSEYWNHDEGHVYVRINSDGLRDREHSKQKPPGVYRIAILGDSYAAAEQVDINDTFCASSALPSPSQTELVAHSPTPSRHSTAAFS